MPVIKSSDVVATFCGHDMTALHVIMLSAAMEGVTVKFGAPTPANADALSDALRDIIDDTPELSYMHRRVLNEGKFSAGLHALMKDSIKDTQGKLYACIAEGKRLYQDEVEPRIKPSLASKLWRIVKRILFPFSK